MERHSNYANVTIKLDVLWTPALRNTCQDNLSRKVYFPCVSLFERKTHVCTYFIAIYHLMLGIKLILRTEEMVRVV